VTVNILAIFVAYLASLEASQPSQSPSWRRVRNGITEDPSLHLLLDSGNAIALRGCEKTLTLTNRGFLLAAICSCGGS
jgi:hypothetical protein